MNIRVLSFSLVLFLAVALAAGCRSEEPGVEAAREDAAGLENREEAPLTAAEKEFITRTEEAHVAERNLARVALEKSQNEAVKDYAQMIEDDHTEALRDLVELMRDKGIDQPGTLADAKEEALAKLEGLSGAEFDREFAQLMVEKHRHAVETFRAQAATAANPAVKEYAEDLLPTLEEHLMDAQELQNKVNSGTKR